MRTSNQPPAEPVGSPASPEVVRQVAHNRERSAEQWEDAALDMAVSDIMVEHEREWDTRWMALALAALVVVIGIVGFMWTHRGNAREQAADAQRAAAQQTPYTPETIR